MHAKNNIFENEITLWKTSFGIVFRAFEITKNKKALKSIPYGETTILPKMCILGVFKLKYQNAKMHATSLIT